MNHVSLDRDQTIKIIKENLKKRSGKSWSVTGGKGTAWGWIKISAPPKRLVDGSLSKEDQDQLTELLGTKVHHQGENIPSSNDYRQEYIERSEGKTPTVQGKPYWD